jgi:hypothetical protein
MKQPRLELMIPWIFTDTFLTLTSSFRVDTIAMTIEIATGDPTVIAIAAGGHPRTIVVVMGHQTTSGGIHLTFVEVRPQVRNEMPWHTRLVYRIYGQNGMS